MQLTADGYHAGETPNWKHRFSVCCFCLCCVFRGGIAPFPLNLSPSTFSARWGGGELQGVDEEGEKRMEGVKNGDLGCFIMAGVDCHYPFTS